jgi:RyR domain
VPSELEKLARTIHEDYVRRKEAEGHSPVDEPSLVPWETLSEPFRESNRNQAADIDRKLDAISCRAVINDAEYDNLPALHFSRDEVEKLAKLEHARWEKERRSAGWTFGPVKDAEGKRSPYLVPWDDLSEDIRDLDRDTVRKIPQFLATLGYVVVRRDKTDNETIL